jgi:hypothetical protein
MHPNSQLLFEKYAIDYFRPGLRKLEIGPDGFPSTYRSMVSDRSLTWDTLDINRRPELTYNATSEYSFPTPDNSYDVVVSGQVIEQCGRSGSGPKRSRACAKSAGSSSPSTP